MPVDVPDASLVIRAQAEEIASLVPRKPGAPRLESDPVTVGKLLAALADGNYRETACKLAGIHKDTLYAALKRGESGDPAAIAFSDALEKAEAQAESEMVSMVRKAAKSGPQFWAAGATWLERKAPERWGRRQDDSQTPRVVVQLGTSDPDIRVSVNTLNITNPQT